MSAELFSFWERVLSWHYGYPTGEALVQELRVNAEKMAQYCQAIRSHSQGYWPSFVREWGEWAGVAKLRLPVLIKV